MRITQLQFSLFLGLIVFVIVYNQHATERRLYKSGIIIKGVVTKVDRRGVDYDFWVANTKFSGNKSTMITKVKIYDSIDVYYDIEDPNVSTADCP